MVDGIETILNENKIDKIIVEEVRLLIHLKKKKEDLEVKDLLILLN